MSEWQPIETAPKDGRRILLAFYVEGRAFYTVIGQWAGPTPEGWQWPRSPCLPPGWHEDGGNINVDRLGPPETRYTHWMPLPVPPSGTHWRYDTGWDPELVPAYSDRQVPPRPTPNTSSRSGE